MRYGRARNYLKMIDGKPTSPIVCSCREYLEEKIKNITQQNPANGTDFLYTNSNSSSIGQSNVNIEPLEYTPGKRQELSSKLEIGAGPMGFEPMTFSLEG